MKNDNFEFVFLTHDNLNAYFNLASEEYLLKHTDKYYIYLWRNDKAVICGINQNTTEEVNLDYTERNGIKVVRRLTGGGAVYHDKDNICYTVIAPFDESVDNYKKFTAPVIEYLNSIGVKAEFSGRNDIVVNGRKISGNAQTVYKDRIMHHGTLLFHTDMSVLEGALKPNKLKIESKGIKSIRARVSNIYDELPTKMNVKEFLDGLCEYFKKDCKEYKFTQKDLQEINKLVDEKYSTFSWNVGYSPNSTNVIEKKFSCGIIKFSFDTLNGKIENAKMTGDFFSKKPIEGFTDKLNGKEFTVENLKSEFRNVDKYIVNADCEEIIKEFFG